MDYKIDDVIEFKNGEYLILDVIKNKENTYLYLINNDEYKETVEKIENKNNTNIENGLKITSSKSWEINIFFLKIGTLKIV